MAGSPSTEERALGRGAEQRGVLWFVSTMDLHGLRQGLCAALLLVG